MYLLLKSSPKNEASLRRVEVIIFFLRSFRSFLDQSNLPVLGLLFSIVRSDGGRRTDNGEEPSGGRDTIAEQTTSLEARERAAIGRGCFRRGYEEIVEGQRVIRKIDRNRQEEVRYIQEGTPKLQLYELHDE